MQVKPMQQMRGILKNALFILLLSAAGTSNAMAQIFSSQHVSLVNSQVATIEFDIRELSVYDERIILMYNLLNDSRFIVSLGETDGVFVVGASDAYEELDLSETFSDFWEQNTNQFSAMDKSAVSELALEYKSELPYDIIASLMMDFYVMSRTNNTCLAAEQFCTDNGLYQYPAGVNAGTGEAGPDYQCLRTTPNPAWFYLQIGNPGSMSIYMYSTPSHDLDFCCWGPFVDPFTPCPDELTANTVVSCSYSASATETCIIPSSAQTGEYYIMVITNYSNQVCNINFSKIDGSGTASCGPYDISVSALPEQGGTISGNGVCYGGQWTVSALANVGYTFMYWTEGDEIVSSDASFTFAPVRDMNLVAHFALPFDVVATANPSQGGTVFGSGAYDYGTLCTLTAVANEGYSFTYWTEDDEIVSYESSYDFVVTGERSLQAHFSLPFVVLATVNPAQGGTVIGSGAYDYGATCTMTASANTGYTFMYWIENSDTLSFDANYSFVVTGDRYLTACFALPFNIMAVSNPSEGGEIVGSGTFDYGTICTLTATANSGYTFMNWTENNEVVSNDADYGFIVTRDRILQANFALPFNITATACPEAGGTVSGGGYYEYGSTCSLEAFANENYTFMYWTEEGEVVSNDPNYSFVVTGERNLQASFSLPLSVVAIANPENGGVVSGYGEYVYGTICTLTATPKPGYEFVCWMEDGELVSTETQYSFTVTSSCILVANFGESFSISVSSNPLEGGTVRIEEANSQTFTRGSRLLAASIDFSEQGYSNGQDLGGQEIFIDDNVSIIFFNGTNSNSPRYFSTGTAVRCYSGNYFTVTTTVGTISDITLTFGSGDGENEITTDVGSFDVSSWNGNDAIVNFFIGGTTYHRRIRTVTVNYTANEGQQIVAAPVFNPSGGIYFGPQLVSIYCDTEGATIHYTTDGSNPTENSAIYDSPITISNNTWLKAIALKDDYEASAIATTVYTISNMMTIAEARALGNNEYAMVQGIVNHINGRYVFIQDATAGIALYLNNNSMPGNLTIGDMVLAYGMKSVYNGLVELIGIDGSSQDFFRIISSGNPLPLTVKSIAEINADDEYTTQSTRIMIQRALIGSINPNGYTPLDQNGSTINIYRIPDFVDVVEGDYVNVIGVIGCYDIPYVMVSFATDVVPTTIQQIESFVSGTTINLVATPNLGYSFVNWTKNGEVVSMDSIYSLTVTENADYVANFSLVDYEITALANPEGDCLVSGGGVFHYGDTCTLTANSNEAYSFTNWTKDGIVVSDNEVYSFVVTESANYVANFVPNNYVISVEANPSNGGVIIFEDYVVLDNYVRVSNVGQLTDGSKVIIAARYDDNPQNYFAIGNTLMTNNKLGTTAFVSNILGYNEILPESITDNEDSYYWTLNITDNGYTFTNVNGDMIGYYGYGTNFLMGGENTVWNLTTSISETGSMVPDYFGFNIVNYNNSMRAFALNSTHVCGAYAYTDVNMTSPGYNFFLDFFVQGDASTPTVTVPIFDLAGGTYYETQTVTLSCPALDATIYYSIESENGPWIEYEEPIVVDEDMTIWAYAAKEGYNDSPIVSAEYVIQADNSIILSQNWEGDWDGWTAVSIEGEASWSINQYAGNRYAYINGYNHGANTDWLISPVFNIDGFNDVELTFRTARNYTGTEIEVFFSNDYDGQNPATATWIPLSCNLSMSSWTWVESGVIDLSGFSGTNCYIGFKYMCDESQAAGWEVDDILLVGDFGQNNREVGYQTYPYGSVATLRAIANSGYAFVRWTEDGEEISTDSVYSFNVTGNRNLVANFATMYTVSVEVSPSNAGTVNGAGTYQAGSTCLLTAIANEGFTFVNWSINGTVISTNPTYGFTVNNNRSLVANFSPMMITASIDPENAGVVTGTGDYTFGSICTLVAIANPDFQFENWTLNGSVVSTDSTFEFVVSESLNLVAHFQYIHTQYFTDGWNWYSTFIEQSGINGLLMLENSLGGSGIRIQGKNAGTDYFESQGVGYWYGSLIALNNEQMYKIRTNAVCDASMTGHITLPINHPITINEGWSWIGFPSSQSIDIATALGSFTPEADDIIKGRNASATFVSSGNYNLWYGPLNTLEPGQGYMYKSNSSETKTLVYQTGRGTEELKPNNTPEVNVFVPAVENYADNMLITAVIEVEGEELRSEDYELAAFVGDECRGSVKLMYVEPFDRYVAFLLAFGEATEEMHFVLTDGNDVSLSDDLVRYETDGTVGTLTEPVTLHFGTLGVGEGMQLPVNIYPNPSKGIFNIEGVSIQKVEVIDTYGQVILSEEVKNDCLQINLRDRAVGAYLLRVVTDKGVTSKKLVLVR